ncbi:AAA family ATPase [Caldanaerobacter sp.]|uniref:AAA family ATPase n=1 Tax=Caldanaerobacter sp. TaxID=2930036 RepID=UPI003C78F634
MKMIMHSKVEDIIKNIQKVIIGKKQAVELALIALLAEGHVLIEDVPGVGKTSLVKALAKSINASFRRIQFTPDLVPSDVLGVTVYNQQKREFEFKPGPIMSNIVLADEINRTSPKTQSSLLEAMEEKQITVDGVTYPLPKPFMVLATQNPIEYEGTFKLPEAQLDRFMVKIEIGYPSEAEEIEILATFSEKNPLEDLKAVVDIEEVIKMQEEVKKVYVEEIVKNYIVNLVAATRKSKAIRLGASPRATLYLMRAAQARAYCQGRDYVLPDDVKALAIPVLSHRIILKNEEKFEGLDERMFIKNIVDTTKVPVVRRYA